VMVPELSMVSKLRMPMLKAEVDIVMSPELEMVPVLKMPSPPVF